LIVSSVIVISECEFAVYAFGFDSALIRF
jgi:hypothetical protein